MTLPDSPEFPDGRTLVPHTSIKAANRHNALLRIPMAHNNEQYTNYGPVFHEAGYWNEAE